jgi:hypothetical protein
VPDTPAFWEELEQGLRREAASTRRRRMPVRATALRSVRELNISSLHAALAVGVAACLLLLSAGGVQPEPNLRPEPGPAIHGYIQQYARPAELTAATVRMAEERGFEVDVVTTFVADRAEHGRIVRMTHAGSPTDTLPEEGVRGPVLIVIGLTFGEGDTIAD